MSFIIRIRCQCGHEFRGPIDKAPLYCSQCGRRLVYESVSAYVSEFQKERVRTRFVDTIRIKLYYYLQDLPNPTFVDYIDIFAISNEIVHAKEEEIDSYLRNHEVTVLDMEKHVNAVIKSILIPYAEKIESGIET